MNTQSLLENLIKKQSLSPECMEEVMQQCMTGQLPQTVLAAFLVLMRAKGETPHELSTAARVMLKHAHTIDLGDDLLDIVGTGGDGKNTFNVSTLSSFVAAAAGARVAKHGNRSVSSSSGSSDVLKTAGFQWTLSETELQACMRQFNLCFLLAPHFHPAMQHAKNTRQELGIRSIFNLLGPLVNPANVQYQVLGTCEREKQQILAEVLANLGRKRALIICSEDGMDEASITAPTHIIEYHQGQFKKWQLNPHEFNCYYSDIRDITVQTPEESMSVMAHVLNGGAGAARDIVVLNSALGLYCAGVCADLSLAVEKARQTLDQGLALERFNQVKIFTQHQGSL